MLEDRGGNLWIGVYDGLYVFKNGRFRRISEPDHQPLGLILAMAEDVDGDIWAMCSGISRKLIRIRDFQVREQFPASASPIGAACGGSARWDLDWPSHEQPLTCALPRWCPERISDRCCRRSGHESPGCPGRWFRHGILRRRARRNTEQGEAQEMTTKNGLPCDAVYSFIADKQKSWWLLTECGIVGLPDSGLERWWATPEAVVQTRLYDALDGAQPGQYGINISGRVPGWAGVVCDRIRRANGGPAQDLAKSAPGADIYRVCHR